MSSSGMRNLALAIQMQIDRTIAANSPPVFDFGSIQEDYSLLTNTFPIPIPQSDYLVCRQLTLGDTGVLLTDTARDGVHAHGDSGAHGGHVEGDGTHVHAGEGPHLHSVRLPESMRRLRPGDQVLVAWIKDDAVVIDLFLPAVALGLPPRLAELLGGGQSGGDGTPVPRPEVPVELEAIARGQGYTTERLGGNRLQIDYGDGVVRVYDKYMVHMTDTGAFLVTIEWFREELISVAKEKAEGAVYALVCTSSGSHAGSLTQTQKEANARYICNFLKKHDWTNEAICGLLGNIQRESALNPGVWEEYSTIANNRGYGLMQWTPPTKFLNSPYADALENYSGNMAERANAWASSDAKAIMDAQLECLIWGCVPTTHSDYREWWPLISMTQPHYNRLPLQYGTPGLMSYSEYTSSTHDVGDLALVFHATYLRSGDDIKALQERVSNAKNWYEYFSNP